jgi:hypothetical protein
MSDHDEFLNSTMVKENDIIVLLDEGAFRDPEETGLQRVVFQIKIGLPDQRQKIWTANKTSRKRFIKAWGDDSANWVGKRVRITITNQNVRGEMRDILWGWPIEEDPTPTQAKIDSPDEKTNAIIAQILAAKPELNRAKVTELIAAEIENSGGTFGKHVATVLVARSLGIDLEKTGKKVA